TRSDRDWSSDVCSSDLFYVVGGTVPRDAPSYIDRQADADLLDALRKGHFCYVLTSRQMGKSSLMVRAASRLRQEGVAVAALDLRSEERRVGKECRSRGQ